MNDRVLRKRPTLDSGCLVILIVDVLARGSAFSVHLETAALQGGPDIPN
jgi:hypothetical protein